MLVSTKLLVFACAGNRDAFWPQGNLNTIATCCLWRNANRWTSAVVATYAPCAVAEKSANLSHKNGEREREEGMCQLFASQNPDSYVYETRSIRLNGQSTSIRLEKMFWKILEQISAMEGMSVPCFISTLHREVLLRWGPVPNFTSHLRCICLVVLEKRSAELPALGLAANNPEPQRHVVG